MNTKINCLSVLVIIICFYCSPAFSIGPNTLPSDPEEQIRLSINELAYNLHEIDPEQEKDKQEKCNCQKPEIPTELSEKINRDTIVRDTKRQLDDLADDRESKIKELIPIQQDLLLVDTDYKKESSKAADAASKFTRAMNLAKGGGTEGFSRRVDGSIDRSEQEYQESRANAERILKNLDELKYRQSILIEAILKIDNKMIQIISNLQNYIITQRALLVSNWEFLDFTKRNNLVSRNSWGTLTAMSKNCIAVGDFQQAENLINMGADTYNRPGEYSNLALAKAFGYTDLVPKLKEIGGTIEVPWAPYPSNPSVKSQELLLSLENRWKKISEFNNRLHQQNLNPFYEYNRDLLNSLRCKINCLKLTYSNRS